MKIKEIEYSELNSTKFKNYRYGIRIQTTDEDYANDFAWLVSEVKTKLNSIIEIATAKRKEVKSESND